MKPAHYIGVAAALVAGACPLMAAVYYVDAANGDNARSGASLQESLASIEEAAGRAGPGDTIYVAEGIYYGPITLNLKGTAEQPITLAALNRERYAVVITNADRGLRQGDTAWELVDAQSGLYRAPLSRPTCRVLYSGADLQPYLSLDMLKTFVGADGNPGPSHGYFYSPQESAIYVRLHASGRYGAADPSQHVMAVGPRTGSGHAGNNYDGPHFYNLGLMERGEQHVIVDGFTFETPGMAGVFVNGSDVTVRNSWFLGCRAGVSGRRQSDNPQETSNRITIEYCDYSQYPAFDDMLEVMRLRGKPADSPRYPLFWWSRKGGGAGSANTYEIGICNLAGADWVVRHNYIHDAFEGLATWGIRWSRGLHVYRNRFERLVDNAIEMEDHASDMHIYENLIVNTVEPLSWQPLGGEPWPGPVYVYGNVIRNDEALNRLIHQVVDYWSPGWFKAGASAQNWDAPWNKHMEGKPRESVRAPGDGIVVFNNTVIFPVGNFLTRVHPKDRLFENFWFYNNVSAAAAFSGSEDSDGLGMHFYANVWIDTGAQNPRAAIFAGEGGTVLEFDSASVDWSLTAEYLLQPAFARSFTAVPVPQALAAFPGADAIQGVGALMGGEHWQIPVTGPRPNEK